LFGSVGTADIAGALSEAGYPVEKSEVRLPKGPFRNIGEYEVEVQLHSDVSVVILLEVVPGG
jgi:large subunit ribosomal protein L9